jgi:hypothetical protein
VKNNPSAIQTLRIARLVHDQVRELGDGEHEDEVEVELDPRDALALVVRQPRCPRPRSRPASCDVPS